jgi:signal transduction histidine kinase
VSLPVQTGSALRLLVIDDDEIDRAQVRRSLRKAAPHIQFTVEEAENPLQAGIAAKGQTFDCILLDYLLPGARATDILPTLIGLQPTAAIVVLTGQGDETIAVELMKAGISDYLPKDGLDPERLWTAVKYAVALAKVRRDTAHFENARRRQAAQQRALVEAAPFISGMLSLEELARVAAEKAREAVGVSDCFVMLRERETETMSLASSGRRLPLQEASTWAKLCKAEAFGRVPRLVPVAGGGVGVIGVGLVARDGTPVGAIAASAPSEATEIEGCEQVLAQLAQIVAVALENARLLRETQAAVRARDEVLAVVSHDLRTPLSNVKLGVALLRQHMVERDATLFERIERNVHHMTHLVDDLVDLARIEGSKLDVNAHGESVQDILHAASALAHPAAEAGQVELVTDGPPLGLRVRADRHRTLQVLSNLLGNAIKFTPRGGRVRLSVEERPGEICFHVEDSGRGISEAEAPHVFARFFRAPGARKGGLGLGLYIAKAVVDAHGGSIWFKSEPGSGTVFSFTLPADCSVLDTGTLLESAGP